jgi:hypothetical protein
VKRYRLLLLPVAAILVWWASRDFLARQFGTWPSIRDPSALRSDCSRLLAIPDWSVRPVDIPPERWPTSISALHPRSVTVRDGVVDLFLSSGGIGSSYGYLVFPDAVDSSTLELHFHTWLYKDGIYFWESQT